MSWIRTHFAQPVTVDEMAASVHMSASSFHVRFKAVTSMSPLQYQKVLRLHEARRLMLFQNTDASDACRRVGYLSPSQFSREVRPFLRERADQRHRAAARGGLRPARRCPLARAARFALHIRVTKVIVTPRTALLLPHMASAGIRRPTNLVILVGIVPVLLVTALAAAPQLARRTVYVTALDRNGLPVTGTDRRRLPRQGGWARAGNRPGRGGHPADADCAAPR